MNYNYTDIFRQFDNFLLSNNKNEWINDGIIFMYIRKSKRCINTQFVDFIDLANVSILEDYQNKGIFTNFISEFIIRYPNLNIFAESILNPIVISILTKFKFSPINDLLNMYLIQEII